MPGVAPGIHVFLDDRKQGFLDDRKQGVDGGDEPGHDVESLLINTKVKHSG